MRYVDSSIRRPDQTVAAWMQEAVQSGISAFRCQAGYFTLDGFALLSSAVKKLADEGAPVKLVLGSNSGATLASHISFLAGSLSIPKANVSLGIVAFDGALFHPKVYHFVRENGSQTAYVGSANLTGPGISGLNIEAGIILDSAEGDKIDILDQIIERIDAWFAGTTVGLSRVSNSSDIETLLEMETLALTQQRRSTRLPDEEVDESPFLRSAARLRPVFRLPRINLPPPATLIGLAAKLDPVERRHFVRHTEASFHYPQGTHLGHLLSILWHFSKDRTATAFDDEYIRLNGSLGTGRIAAYRRQVKYKILAAIELGLLSDVRLVDDLETYVPQLTDTGEALWEELSAHIDEKDLLLSSDADGIPSSTTPKPARYYNQLLLGAQTASENLRLLLRATFLSMPAVRQMLRYLFQVEQSHIVEKAKIYENFFQSPSVERFCDAMGIEPGTHESAKHRCPLLLNILESCGVLEQEASHVRLLKLAISADLLVPEGGDILEGKEIASVLVKHGIQSPSTLSPEQVDGLQALFGKTFLSSSYPLSETLEIPE